MSEVFLGRILEGCSDDTKVLLSVLAHVNGSLSSEQVAWVAERLDVAVFEDLAAVSCAEFVNSSYSMRHALFRDVFLNKLCSEENSSRYHKEYWLCVTRSGISLLRLSVTGSGWERSIKRPGILNSLFLRLMGSFN